MRKITVFFITSFDDTYIYKDVQRVVKLAIDNINSNSLRKYEIELITMDPALLSLPALMSLLCYGLCYILRCYPVFSTLDASLRSLPRVVKTLTVT